jgi:uncharacterized protein Yka (UPF0111/DUF47 family)
VSQSRWFLPETPDIHGLLRRQLALVTEGVAALEAWTAGDPAAAGRVALAEERGAEAKRELLNALRSAFVLPLEPEDLFALSRGIGWVLDYCGDLILEAQALECPPDPRLGEIAGLLAEAVGHLDLAITSLEGSDDQATRAADDAIATVRRLEQSYYAGMAALLDVEDRNERIAYRELYRRCVQLGKIVVDVAERVAYAVVKQS